MSTVHLRGRTCCQCCCMAGTGTHNTNSNQRQTPGDVMALLASCGTSVSGIPSCVLFTCAACRHKEYKWIGRTNKVYKFQGGSHIELPCNEVTGEEGRHLAKLMSDAARAWWKSIVQDPDSFTKPVFYLGLSGWSVTNFLPDGAHDRTPGRVTLLANGAHGFSSVGDRLCFATQVGEHSPQLPTCCVTHCRDAAISCCCSIRFGCAQC
jgi:hypothetical protein